MYLFSCKLEKCISLFLYRMVLLVVICFDCSLVENSSQSRIISSHYVISSNDNYDVKAHHIEMMNRYYYSSDRNPDFFFNADNQIEVVPKQPPVNKVPPKPRAPKPAIPKPVIAQSSDPKLIPASPPALPTGKDQFPFAPSTFPIQHVPAKRLIPESPYSSGFTDRERENMDQSYDRIIATPSVARIVVKAISPQEKQKAFEAVLQNPLPASGTCDHFLSPRGSQAERSHSSQLPNSERFPHPQLRHSGEDALQLPPRALLLQATSRHNFPAIALRPPLPRAGAAKVLSGLHGVSVSDFVVSRASEAAIRHSKELGELRLHGASLRAFRLRHGSQQLH